MPDSNWVEIPHETMRELRRNASDERKYRNVMGEMNVAQFAGVPVHLIDGKWFVDLTPIHSHGMLTKDEARKLLNIQEELVQGSMKYDQAARRISVWDSGQWLVFPEEAFDELEIPHTLTLSPSALQSLKEWKEVRDEDDERLALRQLLAESQQEGDDDDEIG